MVEDNVLDHLLLGQGGLRSALDTLTHEDLKAYETFCLKSIRSGEFGRVYTLVNRNDLIFKVLRFPNDNLANRFQNKPAVLRDHRQMMISKYLNDHYNDLKKYFVRFTYYNSAICLTDTERFPLIIMDRIVDSEYISQYVGECINNKQIDKLKILADEWLKLSKFLTRQNIAHGDLQDENIFVKETTEEGKVQIHIQLVDYDGMYVPDMDENVFRGTGTECGKINYQHPKRIERDDYFSKNMDNFSMLSIYLGLLALIEEPKRWKNHDENSIYFTESDYLNPADSQRFKDLGCSSDPLIQELTKYLVKVLGYASWNYQQHPTIDDIKSLTELIDEYEGSKATWSIVRQSRNQEKLIPVIENDPLIIDPLIIISDTPENTVQNCTWYINNNGDPISQNIELGDELYSYLKRNDLLNTEIRVSAIINDSSIHVPEKKYILAKHEKHEVKILQENDSFIVECNCQNITVEEACWRIDGTPISNNIQLRIDELKEYAKNTKKKDNSESIIPISISVEGRLSNNEYYMSSLEFKFKNQSTSHDKSK